MRVLLGLTGGIACYKAAGLVRLWIKAGHEVRVVMTENATRFITPLTLAALSGNPVTTTLFPEGEGGAMDHIAQAQWADTFVVAPATGNCLGKLAHGIADDALTTTYLAFDGRVLIAPAMNSRMWRHEAVQANAALLAKRGDVIIPPAEGDLACGEEGEGRMADPEDIFHLSLRLGNPKPLLEGKHVLVTAGPTREFIDDVRFLSNPSTGKMGIALALQAFYEGADVTLISGPVSQPLPKIESFQIFSVVSVEEMARAVAEHYPGQEIFIMAAAVGDFTPAHRTRGKIRRSGESLHLDFNPTRDILSSTAAMNPAVLRIGFAAEIGLDDAVISGKLKEKGLDLIVANDVSNGAIGFGSDENEVTIYFKNGEKRELPRASKQLLARQILHETARHERLV